MTTLPPPRGPAQQWPVWERFVLRGVESLTEFVLRSGVNADNYEQLAAFRRRAGAFCDVWDARCKDAGISQEEQESGND